ncbi:hypothetical protein OKW34_005263 [Paraburkholderia youngii]|uniref:hypothetical protein n=1 Tax=Paraburkholderia youngii TaxID=2782701 RepID=UPI003D21BC14
MPEGRRCCEKLNSRAGPKPDFKHAVVFPNLEKADRPSRARLVHLCHNHATEPAEDPFRSTKRSHQNTLERAHDRFSHVACKKSISASSTSIGAFCSQEDSALGAS